MVQIIVASIEQPKPGKKQGAVIDSTGKRWGVWADKLANFQQSTTYDIAFDSNEFQGRTYYVIKTAIPVGGTGNGSKPLPSTSTQSPAYSENQRRMDIFVSVLINNSKLDFVTAPENELVDVINKFKRIWNKVYGPKPDPISSGIRNNDLNDELTF